MKNSSNKLNQLLFSGPENSNRNQNFNNINIISQNSQNNQSQYENNRERFIKTEVSYCNNNNENNHNVSFCTKGDGGWKPENLDFSGASPNSELFYDIHNETTSTNHKNLFDNGNFTDVNIKNKIMNINASLKSFNIHVKSKLISYADFENSRNKNSYINFLLDYIVDLLWIVKADKEAKSELVQRLQRSSSKFEENERKMKKLSSELSETKKYLDNALSKNLKNSEKDKDYLCGIDKKKTFGLAVSISNNKKINCGSCISSNNNYNGNNNYFKNSNYSNFGNNNNNGNSLESEFAFIKAENKKLISQLTVLKNDIKKRELEFSKLQEKVKKLLDEKIAIRPASSGGLNNSFSNNNNINNNFNLISSINNNNNNNFSLRNRNNPNGKLGNDIFKLSSFLGYDLSDNHLAMTGSKKDFKSSNKNESLSNQQKNLYKKFLEFNTHNNLMRKYDSLLNQNSILMGVLFNFQESLDRMNQKIIYFNKNNTKVKTELLDLIKLKENIFSLHLIDKELLNEFSDNFLENIKLFEDLILRIMEFICYENFEWKQKYLKIEKSYYNAKGTLPATADAHHAHYALNSNETEKNNYNSKDSNANSYNKTNGNLENNINNKNKSKEKDLVRNLKRWSIKASLNGPNISSKPKRNNNSSSNTERSGSLRNCNFAGRIFNEDSNIDNNDNIFYENRSSQSRFGQSKNKNQSIIGSVKFL